VKQGESAAFDTSFEFPAFLWNPTRNYRVDLVPRGGDALTFWAWVEQRNVRVLAVGPEHRVLVEARGGWEKRFDCSSSDCAVYARRDALRSAAPVRNLGGHPEPEERAADCDGLARCEAVTPSPRNSAPTLSDLR
jgi:hypothetical protein